MEQKNTIDLTPAEQLYSEEELRKEIAELKIKLEEAQQTADNYWKHILWMRTPDDMKPKAVPCPKCGSEHVGLEGSIGCREFFVWCLDCGAMGPAQSAEREAILAWNALEQPAN